MARIFNVTGSCNPRLHYTGQMAEEIYNYTSGYPFLVSKMCKLLDERIAGEKRFPEKSDAWTKGGICAAVNLLVSEKSNSSAGPELLSGGKELLWI